MKIWLLKKIIKSLDSKDRKEVLTMAVDNLFNTVSSQDIFQQRDGIFFFRDEKLSLERIKNIIAEAENFNNSFLWQALQEEIKYRANKIMFEKSVTADDMVAGKLWLFTLDSFKETISKFIKLGKTR